MYPHIYTYTANDYLRTKENVEVFGPTGFTTMKNKNGIYQQYIYYTDHAKTHKKTIFLDSDDRLFSEIIHFERRPCAITQAAGPSVPREYIVQDFPEVVKKITNTTPILSTLNIPQMFTLSELLWLKVDDVDSRVDHLEKMLAQVIEDNKLLQRLVNDLECRIENLELS